MIRRQRACVQVFARCPRNGKPKTRLQPPLNRLQASDLHRRLLLKTLMTASESNMRLQLWLDQPSDDPWLLDAITRFECEVLTQKGETLGDKMHFAIRHALNAFERVVVIGSDCPAMNAAHIVSAIEHLSAESEFVFVPAEDGGYALMGTRVASPVPFISIDWGSAVVMAQTRSRLREQGIFWSELETLWDVDRPEDLHRLQRAGIELPSLDRRASLN